MLSTKRAVVAFCAAVLAVAGSAGSAIAEPATPSPKAPSVVSIAQDGKYQVETMNDGSRGGWTAPVTTTGVNGVLGGSFSWWVEAAFSKESRQWTSMSNGYTNVKVTKVYDIVGGHPCSSMNITLKHWKGWYWAGLGTKTANGCDGADDLIWATGVGDFKFEANPTRGSGGPYVRAEGVVYYP